MSNQLKICYFGIYNPEYARNRVLIKGLKQNNVEVVEINDRSNSFLKYFRLLVKYFKIKKDFNVMIVGFPGQEMMFLARFLTRKPIIFDAFTSHYGGYILDRKYFSKSGWRAKYYRFMDTWSCRLADMVLLDTQAHIDFFVKEFGLLASKFVRVFVGTDSDVFYPRELIKQNDKFTVHFHGHFIPLQGVEYIIKTANLLKFENIKFQIIGEGQEHDRIKKMARDMELTNITWVGNVSYKELCEYMTSADVCLGIFGDTSKTQLVIPNKVYEAIACGRPVITADTPAIRELFTDKKNIILCKNSDPEDLARKIISLKDNEEKRRFIAENARLLFANCLTGKIISKTVIDSIYERRILSQ